MEIENNPQFPKHKGQKNKGANSSDLRLNKEPQNNSVELPQDQSHLERNALIDDAPATCHCLPSRNIP